MSKDNIKNCIEKNIVYCSLGNYCITSQLLKEAELKFQSCPFDWMLTSLDNIIDILSDNFKEFLNKSNYISINGKNTRNIVYFNKIKKLFKDAVDTHSHHNLLIEVEYKYICRCVERFNNLGKYKKIKFIMIQPLYRNNLKCNYKKIKELSKLLVNKFGIEKVKLYIFNIHKKNNKVYTENKINENLEIYELKSNIIKGPYGMEYFDKSGIKKFNQIIKS